MHGRARTLHPDLLLQLPRRGPGAVLRSEEHEQHGAHPHRRLSRLLLLRLSGGGLGAPGHQKEGRNGRGLLDRLLSVQRRVHVLHGGAGVGPVQDGQQGAYQGLNQLG